MASNAREEILGRLRTAKRQVSPTKPAAAAPGQPAKGEVEVFQREAQIVSAKVTVVPGKDAIAQGVLELLGDREVKSLLVVEDKRLDNAGLKKAARELNAEYISTWELSEKEYQEKAFTCDVGITCCDWGVAETASVVIFHRIDAPRLPSVSPPVHIGILYTERLLKSMKDLALVIKQQEPMPSAVTIISGVSRTADILLTPTLGMHGPLEVGIILVEGSETA
ncbi:MAG: LutC/YkgG family protein [Bacillota bacterium]